MLELRPSTITCTGPERPAESSRLNRGPMCSTIRTRWQSTSGAISASDATVATWWKVGDPVKRATSSREAGAGVLVVDRERDAVEVERGGVAEDEQLDQGRDDDDDPAALVLEEGKELLDRQSVGCAATCAAS